jgi:hypothetical protein
MYEYRNLGLEFAQFAALVAESRMELVVVELANTLAVVVACKWVVVVVVVSTLAVVVSTFVAELELAKIEAEIVERLA